MSEQWAPWISDPDDPADIPNGDTDAFARAVAAMFPELIDKSHDGPLVKSRGLKILGASLAQWAATFAAADEHRIETAIRNGLLSGLENTEVARQVVGSQRLMGVDGATEVTRRQIAQLAGVTFKKRKPKSA